MNYNALFLLLQKRGIRRTTLVKEGVISAATLMRLRRNESVSLHSLECLSRYLGCSIFDLMSLDSEGEQNLSL